MLFLDVHFKAKCCVLSRDRCHDTLLSVQVIGALDIFQNDRVANNRHITFFVFEDRPDLIHHLAIYVGRQLFQVQVKAAGHRFHQKLWELLAEVGQFLFRNPAISITIHFFQSSLGNLGGIVFDLLLGLLDCREKSAKQVHGLVYQVFQEGNQFFRVQKAVFILVVFLPEVTNYRSPNVGSGFIYTRSGGFLGTIKQSLFRIRGFPAAHASPPTPVKNAGTPFLGDECVLFKFDGQDESILLLHQSGVVAMDITELYLKPLVPRNYRFVEQFIRFFGLLFTQFELFLEVLDLPPHKVVVSDF